MQVDNSYNEFEGKVVVDLGCGTVRPAASHLLYMKYNYE